MNREEKINWIRLARTNNIGPIAFFHLIKKFNTATEAVKNLINNQKLNAELIRRNISSIPTIESIEKELHLHEDQGFHLITYNEKNYPHALKKISDPPPVISVRGNLDLLSNSCFGIVGSRNASIHGKRMTELLTKGIVKRKMTVVSGLARGIDTVAHKESIETGTIAVVAGGIDTIYPPENKLLFKEISEKGLIISESPLGIAAHGVLFPKRNRIISGLSWGIVVIEASIRSGSLITVKYAL